ncbi:hypothetical protein F383_08507 [Gossypium arboreum]|uniref:Uncharacterized protein n=1 Tax=Gossypium arboreum TaxID=29729 RepID=A0A0B0NCQ8_GOSAR|nr:hypothetical protein F383_08507 [Gossypium arboreum]
MQGQTFSNMHQ